MQQNNLAKWGYFIGFLILAGISCWATEHSFHLLIGWFPQPLVWAFTIAFFVLASYGSKLVVDACNYDIYLPHRRANFWGGLTLVIAFWLCMSMPTNAHTFFYQHKIGSTVQDDIALTDSYLQQLASRKHTDPAFQEVETKINNLFTDLRNEYNGIGITKRQGGGEVVSYYLGKINDIIASEVGNPEHNITPSSTWNVFNPAQLNIYAREKDNALAYILDNKYKVSHETTEKARKTINELAKMNDTIRIMVQTGGIHEDIVTQSEGVLASGYSTIKNGGKFVVFRNDKDKELYTAENLETRTKQLFSVIDVWMDFFRGKYPMTFLFYILISILVDLGAFLFFDLAFRKTN